MFFRLGYVAMTLNLHDCSPSGTVTVSSFNKLPNEEARINKLRKITKKNLDNTLRILKYNKALNIMVYRLTSRLIPLATHPLTEGWDYVEEFKPQFREIGDFVKTNGMRISAHPDHFTLINSPSEKVFSDSLKDLDYHVKVFSAMGLEDYKYSLVLHVGGMYKDKELSIKRFSDNFAELPYVIRNRIILENDDKCFNATDVLEISEKLNIPMVLDVHHHDCCNSGEKLENILERVFNTWEGHSFYPKIHFSSPKDIKSCRSHADFIDSKRLISFVDVARKTKKDFDIMLEAKSKDDALLRLSEELERTPGFTKINKGKFET